MFNTKGILRRNASFTNIEPSKKAPYVISHNQFNNGSKSLPLEPKDKYFTPEINTAARLGSQLISLQNLDINSQSHDLTPRSKAIVTQKALKKLNFVSSKIAYDRLPPLNVNDTLIKTQQEKQRSKVKKENSTIDVEPNLEDYLRSSEMLQYKLEIIEDDDDEYVAPKSFIEDHHRNLYEVYQEYFDPMALPKSSINFVVKKN
ncbi:uncharacterized protein LOC116341225 [Contarinia nasturtii]|uniref:uncharacterized protein LOC116341225 n=1 Tax=Contarinia nasturtii TaxID=265458 RepID=UPI0012D4419A|nr:uncharacterized protein LOC116341225 [Contarinia nasturtii]